MDKKESRTLSEQLRRLQMDSADLQDIASEIDDVAEDINYWLEYIENRTKDKYIHEAIENIRKLL